jgi:F0F1-type ATP synthase gamma subunit
MVKLSVKHVGNSFSRNFCRCARVLRLSRVRSARQARITTELVEIISGASALEK